MSRYPSYAPDFAVHVNGDPLPAMVRAAVTGISYQDGQNEADRVEIDLANPNLVWLRQHIRGLGFQPFPTAVRIGAFPGIGAPPAGVFDIDNKLELAIGYAPDPLRPMFEGEITGIEASFPNGGMPTMKVVAHDYLNRLARGTKSRGFGLLPDFLIASILSVESRLVPLIDPAITTASTALSAINLIFSGSGRKQAGVSDLQLLQSIADDYDADFWVDGDVLYLSRFVKEYEPRLTLTWGENLLDFSPRISTVGQVAGVSVRFTLREIPLSFVVTVFWDFDRENSRHRHRSGPGGGHRRRRRRSHSDHRRPADQQPGRHRGQRRVHLPRAAQEAQRAPDRLGVDDRRSAHPGRRRHPARGAGTRLQRRLSGDQRLAPDHRRRLHQFRRVGEGDTALMVQALQQITEGIEKLANRFHGVMVGKVVSTEDPLALGRVQVQLPSIDSLDQMPWARVAVPMAGLAHGFYFIPNPLDEVLVAFEHGDLRAPYVIGALWNAMAPPPLPSPLPQIRAIRTPTGNQIMFTETPPTITITTASGTQTITLSPGGVQIVAGSSVVNMTPDGITVTGTPNLNLSASGAINITAPNVTINGVTATNVRSAKECTVVAPMVRIN